MKNIFLSILFCFVSVAYCDIIDDELTNIDITVPEIEVINIDIVNVETPEQPKTPEQIQTVDVNKDIDYMKTIPQIKTIHGYVQYSSNIHNYDEMLDAWNMIADENQTYDLIEKKLNGNRRVICEARASVNSNINVLVDNLAYYKNCGYDTVLLSFDGDSTIEKCIEIANAIHNMDMKIWLAFAESNNYFIILMDNIKFENILTTLSPYCEAYVCGWWYSSVHAVVQPDWFVNYVCKTLRNANEDICIFGEMYKGRNAKNDYEASNFKEGMSGITIVNYDKNRINKKTALAHIKKKYDTDVIAIVCGIPNYLINIPNGLSYSQNLEKHQKLEIEFLTQGCVATMTLSDDGSDESYELGLMDISRTPYFMLESKNFQK